MGYLQAAKDRIRWLSRQVSNLENERKELRNALLAYEKAGFGDSANYHKQMIAFVLGVEVLKDLEEGETRSWQLSSV